MNSGVVVKTKENKDLVRKLKKHKRIALLNESKLLKLASPVRKVFSFLLKLLTAFLLVIAGLFIYSIINAKTKNVVPRYAGISLEKVATGSMVNSGLKVGTNVLVYRVDPHTLRVGDIIAFYSYSGDTSRYDASKCETIYNYPEAHASYYVTIDDFTGKIDPMYESAGRTRSSLIIHHIVAIERNTETGEWWFKTKGSSNPTEDDWHISERMIVGYYPPSILNNIIGKTLNFVTTFVGILIIVGIPLVLLVFVILSSIFNSAQLSLLESEVLEGVRPVYDPVCVKNNIGKNLSSQDKFYLLAKTKEEERLDILPYLYDDGAVPNAINKYYHRKKLMMMPIYEIKDLQYKAQAKYNNGMSITKVMKEYIREKEALEAKHDNYRLLFKEQDKIKFPYTSPSKVKQVRKRKSTKADVTGEKTEAKSTKTKKKSTSNN